VDEGPIVEVNHTPTPATAAGEVWRNHLSAAKEFEMSRKTSGHTATMTGIVVESPFESQLAEESADDDAQLIPSGWYEADFIRHEKVPCDLYKDAHRFDFAIVGGEHAERQVSCTVDMAAEHPVYAPRNLCVPLQAMMTRDANYREYPRCRIYVYQTPIGTNRVDDIIPAKAETKN
jgi:hypothetical protein